MAVPARHHELLTATDDERAILEQIANMLGEVSSQSVSLIGPEGNPVELPNTLVQVLRQATQHLADDEAVSVIAVGRELTSQQAADLLNVSRPYLIEILDRGDIPFHRVGTHRRIALDELLDYRQARDLRRREGLRRLTQKSQRLGLYGRSARE